jgi:hypothetical protein
MALAVEATNRFLEAKLKNWAAPTKSEDELKLVWLLVRAKRVWRVVGWRTAGVGLMVKVNTIRAMDLLQRSAIEPGQPLVSSPKSCFFF